MNRERDWLIDWMMWNLVLEKTNKILKPIIETEVPHDSTFLDDNEGAKIIIGLHSYSSSLNNWTQLVWTYIFYCFFSHIKYIIKIFQNIPY